MVLSNRVEAQGAAIAGGQQDKKTLGEHPLIRNGRKVIPSVTRVFRKNQSLYVYLEAYQATGETAQPVEATVGFYRGKQKVFETAISVMRDGFKMQAKGLPILLTVPLQSLETGKYVCQVSVLNPQAQKVAFWRGPIAVLP